MNAAEKKAASLPPTLTVPMILFFLPGLFAAILTPAAIQIQPLELTRRAPGIVDFRCAPRRADA